MRYVLLALYINAFIVGYVQSSNLQSLSLIYSGSIDAKQLEDSLLEAMHAITKHYRAVYQVSTINEPGLFRLLGSVANQITISSSNVILDMNGNTVSGGQNGIVINNNLSNITIKNGNISTVSSNGISVQSGCSNIVFENVSVKNATRAIFCDNVTNCILRNCQMNSSTTGFEAQNSSNMYLESCYARTNRNAGFSLINSSTCSFIGCKALATGRTNTSASGDASFVFGFVSSNGTGNIFENCLADGTQNNSATDFKTIVAGFGLKQSETSSIIQGSQAFVSQVEMNTGASQACGIFLEPQLSSFQQVASDVSDLSSTTCDFASWSPDGKYILGTFRGITGNKIRIYQFDYVNQTLSQVASIPGVEPNDGTWSRDGRYFVIAERGTSNELKIYEFNRVANTIRLVAETIGTLGTGFLYNARFSPDTRYVAIGGLDVTTNANDFQVFQFDPVGQSLRFIAGALGNAGTAVYAVDWSPDGKYIAIGGEGLSTGSNTVFRVYRLDQAAGTLTEVASDITTGGSIYVGGVQWSATGEYIVIAGNFASDAVRIYRFNKSTETITSLVSAGGSAGAGNKADISPDSKYVTLAAGGITGNDVQIYEFDQKNLTLTSVRSGLGALNVRFANISPSGEYILLGGFLTTGLMRVYTFLGFPQKNMLVNNQVSACIGPSRHPGIGILGSSISNTIITNTVFNNLLNFAYVQNVFNQFYDVGPSALQNISLYTTTPILSTLNVPVELDRIERLAVSLIDNLL